MILGLTSLVALRLVSPEGSPTISMAHIADLVRRMDDGASMPGDYDNWSMHRQGFIAL